MEELYIELKEVFGENEPIFEQELTKYVKDKKNLEKLMIEEKLLNPMRGIYFIPRKTGVLGRPVLSVEKIIRKKYISNGKEIFGYISGTNFANRLGLTSQTASVGTVVTNNATEVVETVMYYKSKTIIKKSKVQVNENNYKILQILDLLMDFEHLSEKPLVEASNQVRKYLKGVKIDEQGIDKMLFQYPKKVKEKFQKLGLSQE